MHDVEEKEENRKNRMLCCSLLLRNMSLASLSPTLWPWLLKYAHFLFDIFEASVFYIPNKFRANIFKRYSCVLVSLMSKNDGRTFFIISGNFSSSMLRFFLSV